LISFFGDKTGSPVSTGSFSLFCVFRFFFFGDGLADFRGIDEVPKQASNVTCLVGVGV
jgi:hypothetical protein